LVVGLVWLAVTVVGVLLAPSVSGVLKSGVQLNSSAYTANQQIAKQYGGTTANPGIIVIDLPTGTTVTSPGMPARLQALDTQVQKSGTREISYASTGNRSLVSNGGRSTILMVFPPQANTDVPPQVLDQLAGAARSALPTATVHATGKAALAAGNASQGNSSVLTELLIGALAALLVLAWVFGSFLALLPLIMAIVSVLTMQLLVYALSFVMPASTPFNPAVQYIVALLGLGLSIDYSLLIVNRWREERAAGKPNDEAIHARDAVVRIDEKPLPIERYDLDIERCCSGVDRARWIEPSGTGWARGKSSTPGRKSILTHVASSGDVKVCCLLIAVCSCWLTKSGWRREE